jgi:hypothetical protein
MSRKPDEPAPPPEPMLSGTFAIFERPDGAMVFSWRDAANGQTGQRVIPSAMVKLGRKMAARAAADGVPHPLLLD